MMRSVDVDGVMIRVRTAGFGERGLGQAAVVFESGATAPLETWDPVLPAVAAFAPVVVYDRAGTGESDWDELPPTPERVGARLSRLLVQLEVVPPYILVGHSWGGALVRFFAGMHPELIAGILYIDPTDITLTKADLIALFESFGAGAAEYEAFNRIMMQGMCNAPAPLRAESEVIMGLLDGDLRSREIPVAPDVPTSVIVAGEVGVPPQGSLPFDTRAYANALHDSQVRRLRGWVRNGGTFHLAASAGHFVHRDDPELVIHAIRKLADDRAGGRGPGADPVS
jgi:pimeloyl-ACP methyl ester carboxylesterase